MSATSFKKVFARYGEIGIFAIAAVAVTFFSLTSGGKWANAFNIGTILQVTATLGLISLGVALVMGTGEIDISVGSTLGMGALTYLWLAIRIDPSLAAVAATVVGAAIGWFNGFLVTKTKAPSLIITLGTLMIFRGIAIALTDGFSFSMPYEQRDNLTYSILGGGDLLGFNTAIVWLALGLVLLSVLLYSTPFGNWLLAVGGSTDSAHSRGVRVGKTKTTAFIVCGALSAFAGALEAGKLGFADGSMGRQMELQAIASCVLGGCLLAGGRVSLVGTILGTFLLSSIQSYLVVMAVKPQWFILLLGLIVVFASYGDQRFRVWAAKV